MPGAEYEVVSNGASRAAESTSRFRAKDFDVESGVKSSIKPTARAVADYGSRKCKGCGNSFSPTGARQLYCTVCSKRSTALKSRAEVKSNVTPVAAAPGKYDAVIGDLLDKRNAIDTVIGMLREMNR